MDDSKPMSKKDTSNTAIALMGNDIKYLIQKVDKIEQNQLENFVTKTEFEPYKRTLQMVLGLIITAVVGGLLTLVIRQ